MSSDYGWDQMLASLQGQETECIPSDPPPAAGAAPARASEDEPMGWLMCTLRAAIEELMAAEVPPLQRANAIARLGSLFLRAQRAAELQRANKALEAQVKELETRLAALEVAKRKAAVEDARPLAGSRTIPKKPAEAQLATTGAAAPSVGAEQPKPTQPTAADQPVASMSGDRPPGGATVCPAGAPAVTLAGARGSP